jgi:hypothetical protein
MSRLLGLLVPVAMVLLLAGCSASPTPVPSRVAQQRTCGRLTTSACQQVIATVEATDPAAASSSLAIADYALPPGPLAASSGGDAFDYLVAFAPWAPQASQGPYLSPPMWQVTEAGSAWSAKPVYVTDVSVCFITLLRDASLTDYAPSFPSGVCG